MELGVVYISLAEARYSDTFLNWQRRQPKANVTQCTIGERYPPKEDYQLGIERELPWYPTRGEVPSERSLLKKMGDLRWNGSLNTGKMWNVLEEAKLID